MNTVEPVMMKELKDIDNTTLINFRVRKILMICSNYDAFILEEDGQIENQIYKEYLDLNLTNPPKFVWVQLEPEQSGEFLVVQWLGLCTFIAEGPGSIPH